MKEQIEKEIKALELDNFLIEMDDYAYTKGLWARHDENTRKIERLQKQLATA